MFKSSLRFGAIMTLSSGLVLFAAQANSPGPQPRIRTAVDDQARVTLRGNTRPEATPAHDLGQVEDNLTLEHVQLLLKRSAEQQAALDAYTESLSDKTSPIFHKWLTPEQFGATYGVAQQDIDTVTGWLTLHGLTVNAVYPNRIVIDFSGSAAQIREAFSTEIHRYQAKGQIHFANAADPQIPAALEPVIEGIVSLHDFKPRPMNKPRSKYTFDSGGFAYFAITPPDLATIYHLNKLFSAGLTGKGQTIVVIENTNVFSTADWTTFRKTFGLSKYTSGKFLQVHPAPKTGTNNCVNPGAQTGNDGEAILDAEYSSAAAPDATIELASCADTDTTFGGLIALQNLLNSSAKPPALVSISWGECEAFNGAAANAVYSKTYQQAVAEGVSVFVSTGDEGAASCDANELIATHGIGVSAFASTPYNVAVGGTDFSDVYSGTTATYWNSTNTSTGGSAKSYIPEIPWNDSCASLVIAHAEGFGATYGAKGFCNSATGEDFFLTTASASGGPSHCATGTPSVSGVVSGTCRGQKKPSWQSIAGNTADGVRDIPDVSLFAANGVWGHYYVFCYSNTAGGGAPCKGPASGWAGGGGTSFSTPIMAGIQALVNEKWGRQGNPNPVYYKIARAEYGAAGSSACNSTKGIGTASSCVFYDVTQGDMDINCTGTHNCFRPSGTNGVLSTSDTAYSRAYKTNTGWDFATGIGTVNAYNLVFNPSW
jgi:subtilase family serine protease